MRRHGANSVTIGGAVSSKQVALVPSLETSVWQQGQIIDLEITDLNQSGAGVGRWGSEQRVVFVPETVPGDRIRARLVQVKPRYAYGQLQELQVASTHRLRSRCIVADKCGGCQWQTVSYDYQLQAKQNQVMQALTRIGKLTDPLVEPILAAPADLHYRNKATYPLGQSRQAQPPKVLAGYYQKGTHRLINLNQCPVQDDRLDPLLAGVKQDIQRLSWPIYDEQQHQGSLRHLALRVGRRTGEILLTLVSREAQLAGLEQQATTWLERYPDLVGVCLNINCDRTNRIFGESTHCLAGRPYLREILCDLEFHIRPETFFQVYTEQAEALVNLMLAHLNLQGTETIVDAYCGVGTMTLPLARQAQTVIGLEVQAAAVEQAQANAALNSINNVQFQVGSVEQLLPALTVRPDLVLLDPPRKGCDPAVLQSLTQTCPAQIVYVSCNPTTLARDLAHLVEGGYQLVRVQPIDFFPQTTHVESVAFLVHAHD